MTKDEMKNKISMALKDPILQQGFEIICKNLAELEKDKTYLDESFDKQIQATLDLQKENAELKKKFENLQKYLDTQNSYRECAETWQKLAQAKKLLAEVTQKYKLRTYGEKFTDYKLIEQAEQFLKDIKE